MSNPILYSDKERRRFRRYAISSALFGCISEQLLDSNSLIIIYLVALGGNESFTMLSTSLSTLCGMLLLIPSAGLANRIGLRLSYSVSCFGSLFAYLLMAAAPCIVPIAYAKYLVIAGCLFYCLMRYPYSVSWYPMLDMFLKPEERNKFFGTMRFSYMLLNAAIIYGIGKLLGEKPPLYIMQLVIAAAGIMVMGRKFCMDRMPDNPEVKQNKVEIKKSLSISLHNAPLVGLSFYICFISIATNSAMPLAVIYMKGQLNYTPETIMTLTSIYLCGLISGYALIGSLLRRMPSKYLQISMHTTYLMAILLLCTILPGQSWSPYLMAVIMFEIGIAGAFMSCFHSAEMMATAKPGNKLMATAFCQTFFNIGVAVGRTGTTLILAAGVLAPEWIFCGIKLTSFNFLFLFYLLMTLFFYLLLIISPSIISKHDDYYEPR